MPTKRERDYYRMGFTDGYRDGIFGDVKHKFPDTRVERETTIESWQEKYGTRSAPKKKRKLSAWNKYVKANSKKPRFRYRNGKLNLRKMGVAFRKTPAGRKKK